MTHGRPSTTGPIPYSFAASTETMNIRHAGHPGTIAEAPLTGGRPTALVRTGLESPTGVAVDASHVYWADSGSGTVSERSLAGGIMITLYVSNQFTAPAGVAVDSGHVYWANSGTGTINEVPLTGDPVKLFLVSAAGSGYWFICSDTAQSRSAASGSSA